MTVSDSVKMSDGCPPMNPSESPFLTVSPDDWLCSNELAFAIFDGFPVSPGHVLVTTRRIVETWFDASDVAKYVKCLVGKIYTFGSENSE